MANWYCDYTNGNDANAGTIGAPKQTIQATINIATGGDTINIANTSEQIVVAQLTFNTGFTAVANTPLKFVSWDNGGALTIQRPDEANPRVAAHISGANLVTKLFSDTARPNYITIENLKIRRFTGKMVELYAYSAVIGCEFDCENTSGRDCLTTWSECFIYNNYFHSIFNCATTGAIVPGASSLVINNWIEGTPTFQTRILLLLTANYNTAYGNIIKLIGAGLALAAGRGMQVFNNTIISDGSASVQYGISLATDRHFVYNNLFYNFDGVGNIPLRNNSVSALSVLIGNNYYFDCNAPNAINATVNLADVTSAGNPFTNLAGNDLSLLAAYRGTGLSNPEASIDVGAVQSAGSGGGGSNIFILND